MGKLEENISWSDAFILMYSVINKSSFIKLLKYYNIILQVAVKRKINKKVNITKRKWREGESKKEERKRLHYQIYDRI